MHCRALQLAKQTNRIRLSICHFVDNLSQKDILCVRVSICPKKAAYVIITITSNKTTIQYNQQMSTFPSVYTFYSRVNPTFWIRKLHWSGFHRANYLIKMSIHPSIQFLSPPEGLISVTPQSLLKLLLSAKG